MNLGHNYLGFFYINTHFHERVQNLCGAHATFFHAQLDSLLTTPYNYTISFDHIGLLITHYAVYLPEW